MKIHIGTKWLDHNKRECTVFDCYTTTNSAGIEIKKEWVSYHTFCGQRVESVDGQTTILIGQARLEKSTAA